MAPSEWKAGIPVPDIPLEMMFESSLSDSRRTLGLDVMLGARSLPRPSRPWQPAQVVEKIRFPPGEAAGLAPASCAKEGASINAPHRHTAAIPRCAELRILRFNQVKLTSSAVSCQRNDVRTRILLQLA